MDRSIGTFTGGWVMVVVVPSGLVMVVLAYSLATLILNCTSPWNAARGVDSSPSPITPVV